MNDDEVWKTYPEIEWLQGSGFGDVRTLDHWVKHWRGGKRLIKGHILKQYRNKKGYMYVAFGVDGKLVHLYVHRIIAACFLENPDNLSEINHLDCNPANNCAKNLEWCSHKKNIAYRDRLGHVNYKDNAPKSPVITINLNTLETLRFQSQHEAARQLGITHSNINGVIKGRYKQTRGFWFTNADNHALEKVRTKFGDSVARKVEKLLNEED